MQELSERETELVDRFEEFYRERYWENVLELVKGYPRDTKSLYIEFKDLWTWDADIADDWLDYPEKFNRVATEALRSVDIPADIDLDKVNVRLQDKEGYNEYIDVSSLRSDDIGSFHNVRGIMDKVTESVPRIDTAVFVCQQCGADTVVPQTRGKFQDPYQCGSCEKQGPFKLDASESEFVDIRKLKLKQPPEESVNGRGEDVTVFVEDDLVDSGLGKPFPAHVGERITVHGILNLNEKELEKRNADSEADVYLEGRSITFEESGAADIDLEEYKDDIEELKAMDDEELFEAYKKSISPQITADEELDAVLTGAVAYLFNGYRIDQDNGSYRGDLHMGIIGDPGRGKSQILEDIAELAPKSEFRSATGFSEGSGVPLTAAAVQEEFAGKSEWTLQPGILPRANGGHCIIDEIDAAVDANTKKLHDAIEGQQILKVDKAGIKADLYTRTPLLISGNPKDGRFDPYNNSIVEEIDLDPALISRLDILLGVQDIPEPEFDQELSDHVLDSWDELSRAEVAERVDRDVEIREETTERPIPKDVFRAAIYYARENVFPVPTEEAKDILGEFYVDTRNQNDSDAVPVTARTLLAGLRIATAFARSMFSETIEPKHAEMAVEQSKKVIGLNFDADSGEIDVDSKITGTPKSQRDRMKRAKDIIEDLAEPDTDPEQETVLEELRDTGVGETTAEKTIESLLQNGEAYEPSNNTIRLT